MSKDKVNAFGKVKLEYIQGSALSLTEIAKKYGVSKSHVYALKNKEGWDEARKAYRMQAAKAAAEALYKECGNANIRVDRLYKCVDRALDELEKAFDTLHIAMEEEKVRTYETTAEGVTVETTRVRRVQALKQPPKVDYKELEVLSRVLKTVCDAVRGEAVQTIEETESGIVLIPAITNAAIQEVEAVENGGE